MGGVVACRLAIGMAQGMFLPAAHSVLGHWIPTAHRGRHFAFAMSGMYGGAATAMVTVPIVGEYGMWRGGTVGCAVPKVCRPCCGSAVDCSSRKDRNMRV